MLGIVESELLVGGEDEGSAVGRAQFLVREAQEPGDSVGDVGAAIRALDPALKSADDLTSGAGRAETRAAQVVCDVEGSVFQMGLLRSRIGSRPSRSGGPK